MDSKQKRVVSQIKEYKQRLLNTSREISLTDILHSEGCRRILSECREFRDRIYTSIKDQFQGVFATD